MAERSIKWDYIHLLCLGNLLGNLFYPNLKQSQINYKLIWKLILFVKRFMFLSEWQMIPDLLLIQPLK